MNRRVMFATVSLIVTCSVFTARSAFGDSAGLFSADLSGYEEVPSALSTPASGWFVAWVSGDSIRYQLHYEDVPTPAQQGHIHFGQRALNGGIIAYLCSNLSGAPAGTPACPPAPATVTGTLTASSVVGPADQGIDPGEFDELVAAIRAGATYINVHTSGRAMGEIRGQVERLRR